MTWWIWTIVLIYGLGFAAMFLLHMFFVQMVTVPLALLRSAFWPVFIGTRGRWPRGAQLPMD